MKNNLKTAATNTEHPHRLRLSGPVVGLTLLTLGLVACGSSTTSAPQTNTTAVTPAASTSDGTNPDIALVPYKYDGTDHSWSAKSAGTLSTQAISDGNNALSAQNYSSATNGWGPVEINKSNGESKGGDGNTITLNGKTYSTGLGVHAASEVNYDLNGQCTGFQTDMGVDDEVRSLGSVTFEIWADGIKLYDSGLMTGNSATKSASVDLTGKKQLKLVVTNGGDDLSYDHADWAGATLIGCKGSNTSNGWTSVASEYQNFTLTASATVRYGVGTSWTQKTLSAGTYTCGNSLFGDPASGYAKHCEVLSSNNGSVAPVSATITYSGPLVIKKGGTYSGNWESQNPNVPAIQVQTSDPVIIENSNVRGRGDLISGFSNRLTVRNVNGYGLNPNIVGQTVGKFVNAEEFINIRVENSYAENTIGLYFRSYKGNPANGDTVTVLKNKFKNINGLPSSGSNGYNLDYFSGRAHMIMFNDVKRIPNVEIAWNEVINEPGKSLVEENINIYTSGGTPDSPIRIHDNYIQGAYNAQPAAKGEYAGGGIILGDGALYAPDIAGYTNVYSNQIVSTTNQGISIAGGVENHVHDNRIISSGLLKDGTRIPAQNVGMYMWNSGAGPSGQKAKFFNNTIENNYVSWVKINESGASIPHPWWFPDCGADNNTCAKNISNDSPTLASENREFTAWLEKLKAQNIIIGNVK